MILFNTKYSETYNKIIYNFMGIEQFDNEERIGNIIECCIPKYLRREQFENCIEAYQDIYLWLNDDFIHELTPFHEFLLYYFLQYINDISMDVYNFKKIYYNDEINKLILETSKKEYREVKKQDKDITLNFVKELFYDINYYSDFLFEDTDFILIENIYNDNLMDKSIINNMLGINIDNYFDLMPKDIKKKYGEHITLVGELRDFFNYLQKNIKHGNLDLLFWNKTIAVSENQIQIILGNLMDAYFHNLNLEICRETILGHGKVDFKVFRSNNKNEKVLIEIKKASKTLILKNCFQEQLSEYLKTSGYKNSYYLIFCFTDKEYDMVQKFISQCVYTDSIQYYINIYILDVRNKKSPSSIVIKNS